MPCHDPIPALLEYVAPGKTRMKLHPTKEPPNRWLDCQKCLGCMDVRAAKWTIRLQHESRQHSHNIFLTLTNDDDHYQTGLDKSTLQLFWKRLRKYLQTQGLKYYACGEYGDRTKRAHYHAAVFGLAALPDSKKWDTDNTTSETLNRIWGRGNVLCSELTRHRMAYCAGYVLKKAGYKKIYCDEDGVELQGPFQIPSQGLGKRWLDTYATDLRDGWLLDETRKLGIPRYYTDKIAHKWDNVKFHNNDGPAVKDAMKLLRVKEQIQKAREQYAAELEPPERARLDAARAIKEQQVKKRRRDRV